MAINLPTFTPKVPPMSFRPFPDHRQAGPTPRDSQSERRKSVCSLGITAQELEAELFDPWQR